MIKTFTPNLFLLGFAALMFTSAPLNATAKYTLETLNAVLMVPDGETIHRQDVEAMLKTPQWQKLDPNWSQTSGEQISVFRFGATQVIRIIPHVQNRPVLGATRIITLRNGQVIRANAFHSLKVLGAFQVGDHEALLKAHNLNPKSLFVDPSVERIQGFTTHIWYAVPGGLQPVIKVRIPTLRLDDLHEYYINGQDGQLLRRQAVAVFFDGGLEEEMATTDAGGTDDSMGSTDAGTPTPSGSDEVQANVFVHAPHPDGVDADDLVNVSLSGLQNTTAGDYLQGWHFATRNCCKYYTCSSDLVEGQCPLEARRCTDDTESEDAILSELEIAIPTEDLPSAVATFFSGDTLYAKSVFCAELPRAQAQDDNGTLSFNYTPVDKTRGTSESDGLASEEDAFAEVQVYYASQQFFEHIRGVMEDPTFCLEALSMDCNEDGTPVLDDNGQPAWPFRISTNLLMPEFDLQALGAQLFAGLGQSAEEPVVINDYQRLGNAAFVPSMTGSPIEVPDGLDALTEFFNRPYDSNIYLQGVRDFSYDGDIVYHEFTHALVHTLAYGLGQGGYDKYGTHVEGGALNEGWADYFSASFTDDSATGEYGGRGITQGETGLRNADNDKKCPDDLIGEVHEDSTPFSGALWEIRAAVKADLGDEGVADLDQLILGTIAEAEMTETFSDHIAKILAAIPGTLGESWVETANTAFDRHSVNNCVRVYDLVAAEENGQASTNPKAMLMQPAPSSVGLDLAPPVMQFKVSVPANTDDITLIWSQAAGGGLFGGGDVTPLKVLVAETDAPIEWKYEGPNGRTPTPYFADGSTVPFDIQASELIASVGATDNNSGQAPVNYPFNNDSCDAKTYHVSLLSSEGSATLYNINATVSVDAKACGGGTEEELEGETEEEDDSDEDAVAPAAQGCGCNSSDNSQSKATLYFLFVLLLLGFFNRRGLKGRRTIP
ncbi:MAG: hypothetical protein CMH56_03390 [Myxococcales bacterium]|nr:hypothetical protein [Myxococcales bacterium]